MLITLLSGFVYLCLEWRLQDADDEYVNNDDDVEEVDSDLWYQEKMCYLC